MVPGPKHNPGLEDSPARNRHRMREVMVWEKPAPIVNAANTGKAMRYTILRPNVSLIGAACGKWCQEVQLEHEVHSCLE